jgi:hypothetical protein
LPEDALEAFLEERWKGMRPLSWGHGLRQMELMRRIYIEMLAVQPFEAVDD